MRDGAGRGRVGRDRRDAPASCRASGGSSCWPARSPARIALVVARWLARGMTQPLRDMAGRRTADGDRRLLPARPHARRATRSGSSPTAFNRMSAELENLERLRRDLVANVSHELKTPIAAIRAHLENLLDGVEQPDPATLQVMLDADASAWAGWSSSSWTCRGWSPASCRCTASESPARAARDPGALRDRGRAARTAASIVESALADRPAAGRRRPRARPPGAVQPARQRRAVHAGGRRRHGRRRSGTNGSRRGAAWPTPGVGIPPEHLPRLFERFYRVDPARSREDGGTGIGLAIARSVVEAHGGHIRAESEPGEGSVFTFDLPVAAAAKNRREP